MLKKLFWLSLLIWSTSSLADNTNNSAETAANTIYTEDKPNIIATPKQTQFIIKLKSNATTGYTWFLRDYNSNLITPVKHSYEAPMNNLIGASGFEYWTFKVKPSGFTVPQQTVIRMVYARPWQGADNSTQVVFRVTTQGK